MSTCSIARIPGFHALVLTLTLALVPPDSLASDTPPPCRPLPLSLPAHLVRDLAPGDLLTNLTHHPSTNGFTWLTWNGSPSAPALARNLHPHLTPDPYVNPDNPHDHHLDPGKWVRAKPGFAASAAVRIALDHLANRELILPIHDLVRGHGERIDCRILAFARFHLLHHTLRGHHCLTLRFLGYAHCQSQVQPPRVEAGPDQSLLEPGPAELNATVTAQPDTTPPTVQWSQVDGPAPAHFEDASRPSTTVLLPAPGSYILRCTASNAAGSHHDDLTLTVEEPNFAPIASNLELSTPEDTPLNLELQAADPDHDPLSWHIVSPPNHGELLGTPPLLTYTPHPDFNGSDTFTFLVNDALLDSPPATVTLTISPVNDPPSAEDSSTVTPEDSPILVSLTGADVEQATLQGRILTSPSHGSLTATPDPLQFLYNPQLNFHGSDSFTFALSDGELQSSPASLHILTTPVNDPPSVDAGPTAVLLDWPANTLTLNPIITDDSLDSLEVLWQQIDGPQVVAFADPLDPITAVSFPAPGRYTLTLTVHDGEFIRSTSLEVLLNLPPRADAGPGRLATPNQWLPLEGAASDDGLPLNQLSTSWSCTTGPATPDFEDPHAPATRVRFPLPGTYSLQLQTSDGRQTAASQVIWLVQEPRGNQPPTVTAGPDQSIAYTSSTQLRGAASDDGLPTPTTLSASWTVVSSPAPVFFDNSFQTSTRASFTEAGTYQLRLTASDGLASAADDITIRVQPDNLAPTVDAGPDQSFVMPDLHSLAPDPSNPSKPEPILSTSILSTDHWDPEIGRPGLDGQTYENALSGQGTNIFIAGTFAQAGGIEAIGSARWDGTRFHPLFDPRPLPLPNFGTHINYATHECGSSYYCNNDLETVSARGPEAFFSGTLKELATVSDGYWDMTARWSGSTWEPWTFKQAGNHVYALLATTNLVYVGGRFAAQPTDASALDFPTLPWVYAIIAWHSTHGWTNLGHGIVDIRDYPQSSFPVRNIYHATVAALALAPDGSLIAGGTFKSQTPSGLANHIARWNGSSWEPLGSGLTGTGRNFTVQALAFSPDGSLFAAGNFSAAGGVPTRNIARWDGQQWHPLGTADLNGLNYTVRALAFHRHSLYVGGDFIEASGISSRGLARWNGFTWSPVGPASQPGVNGAVRSLLAHDDGIFATGEFTAASSTPSTNIALWRFATPPPTTLQLHGQVHDDQRPTSSPLHIEWSQLSGPGTATFSHPHQPNTTVSFSTSGTYSLQLTAHDGHLSSSDLTTVTVIANLPPTANAGPDLSIALNESITLSGSVSDDSLPTNTPLHHLWSMAAGPGSVTFANPTDLTTTATFSAQGTYRLRLTAHDGQFSDADDLNVIVGDPNLPPHVYPDFPPYTVRAGSPFILSGTVTDHTPTDLPTRTIWTALDAAGPVTFNNATSPYVTVTLWAPGTYTLALVGTDGHFSSSANRSLTVLPPYASPLPNPPDHPNQPPSIKLHPIPTLIANSPVPLLANLTDDHLPPPQLTSIWSSPSGPARVLFNNANLTNPTALFPLPGTYTLQLTATDGTRSTTATLIVQVDPPTNSPPIVHAGPSLEITRPATANLSGSALDDALPANATLTTSWSVLQGPGIVSFTPNPASPTTRATFSSPGHYLLQLSASDSEFTSSATLLIRVHDATNAPPIVHADANRIAAVHDLVPLLGTADDDGLPSGTLRSQWTQADGPALASITQLNQQWFATCPTPGTYSFHFSASDSDLTASDSLTVTILADISDPIARLEDLPDPTTLTSPTPITGTVASPILQSWTLDLALPDSTINPDSWLPIAQGTTPIDAATLGTLDTTTLPNGPAILRLRATDASGRSSEDQRTLLIQGHLKPGILTLSATDLTLPIAGHPLRIQRTYDSRRALLNQHSPLGIGWSLDSFNVRVHSSIPLGEHWEQIQSGSWFSLAHSKPHVVSISFPGDHSLHFLARPAISTQFGRPFEWTALSFTNLPGTTGTLTIDGDPEAAVLGFSGPAQLIRFDQFDLFNPTRFRLQTADGWILHLDTTLGLTAFSDPDGRLTSFTTSGITHSSGLQLPFERDHLDRITALTAPDLSRTEYSYDASNRLASVTTANLTTRYLYNAQNLLVQVIGPDGTTHLLSTFDDSNRLASQQDAAGHTTHLNLDLPNHRELITDRLGHTTTHFHDPRGNRIASIDPLGYATLRTFDSHHLPTSITRLAQPVDPTSLTPPANSGPSRTVRFDYNHLDQLTRYTDPLNRQTTFSYGPNNSLQSITFPSGTGLTNTLDPTGHILATFDAQGLLASHSFSNGLPESTTNALGHVTRFSHDAHGRLLSTTDHLNRSLALNRDPLGRVLSQTITLPDSHPILFQQFAYDPAGQPTNLVHADGTTVSIQRDPLGRPLQIIHPLQRTNSFIYDLAGNLIADIQPDDARTLYAYDPEGRLVAVTNALGHVTQLLRDPLGRITQIVHPNSTTESFYYNAYGEPVVATDPRGHHTWFDYDNAGQLVTVTNALGHVTRFAYDLDGHRTTLTDPLGHTTVTTYNHQHQPTRILHPDSTTESAAYDPLGRLIQQTDTLGHTTSWAYDADHHPAAVTNALGHVTRYSHDFLGRLTSITDANNHTSTYDYDLAGRPVRHTLPLGQSESFHYDPAGRLSQHTDFNGQTNTYTYDNRDRLISRTPDPRTGEPTSLFAYDHLNRLTAAADSHSVSTFTYDNLGRLLTRQLQLPGLSTAFSLHYERDPAGLLTHLQSSTRHTDTRYQYNSLGQLVATSDAAAGLTSYAYDPAGNLASIQLPNSVTHTLSHNSRNRLTRLLSTSARGPVADLQYELDPLGRRISSTSTLYLDPQHPSELTSVYTHDALSQLTSESTLDSQLNPLSTLTYLYDPAGNRILTTTSSSPADAPTQFTAGFDANDRPLAFNHDPNGNPINGLTPLNQPFLDSYNSLNRLRSRVFPENPAHSINILYTPLGERLATTTSSPNGSLTTLQLLDDQNPTGLSQILEQLELQPGSAPALRRASTFGLILHAERTAAPNGPLLAYTGPDALGSVRHLTDTAGQLIASLDYDAFGNLTEALTRNPTDPTFRPASPDSPALPLHRFGAAPWNADLALYHLRARDYDPVLGRFRTQDPFPGLLSDPMSLHRYLYAHNDPVNRIDPTGCFDLASVSLGMAIGRTMHDMYDTTVAATGYGLIETVEGIAQGRSDEEILLRYEVGSVVGAGVGMVIGKIAGIAGRALIGELPFPSPSKLSQSARSYLNRQTLWAREVIKSFSTARSLRSHPNTPELTAYSTPVQLEFAFARGASIQTPQVTSAGEVFVRVGATPQSLKFGSQSLQGVQPGTYAFPEATFAAIGPDPRALKHFGDLPGAEPLYFRLLRPPPGTPIQRGIVPGGEFGGIGGVEEVIFLKGF